MIKGRSDLSNSGDFETIPEGSYVLQIVDVNDTVLTYKGKEKPGFQFKFAILDDYKLPESKESTRGRFLWWPVSNSINKRSNLHKLAANALRRKLTEAEQDIDSKECLNPNDLVGLQLVGVVEHNEGKDERVWANVTSTSMLLKKEHELKPVEYEPEEDTVTETATKSIADVDVSDEDLDDELDEVLKNPALDAVMDDEDDEDEDEDEDEDDEDDEDEDDEDEDEDDEDELAELATAARKAEKRLAAAKATRKKLVKKVKKTKKKSIK